MTFNKPLNCAIEHFVEHFREVVKTTPETRPSVDSATRAISMILETMTTTDGQLLVFENLIESLPKETRLSFKTKLTGGLGGPDHEEDMQWKS